MDAKTFPAAMGVKSGDLLGVSRRGRVYPLGRYQRKHTSLIPIGTAATDAKRGEKVPLMVVGGAYYEWGIYESQRGR